MATLPQILKSWHLEKQVLTSPPLEKKAFKLVKQLLTRAMVRADYAEKQSIIIISLKPDNLTGKNNIERLDKMNVRW